MGGLSRDQRGVASILGTALIGVLVSVSVAVTGGVAVVAAHRSAQSAADLAALAGAGALQQGADPCSAAADVARANRTILRGCRVDGWNVAVVVVSRARLPIGRVDLPARANAGPATV